MLARNKDREVKLNLTLSNTTLKQSNELKILGLIFDNKLNWKNQIDKLTRTCNERLNVLKILAANNWGADKKILINTYKSIVLSKIDYGSIVYSSSKQINRLNSIHNSGIRISVGAFRTSPIYSLLAESGIPPLNYRR